MLTPPECIAVAISGGADSLMSLLMLKEQGISLMAVHGNFIPESLQTLQEREKKATTQALLQEHCTSLGIPLHVIDLTTEFMQQVIHPFIQSYIAGETPNPCALCNAHIKFGLLMDKAHALGASRLATGHYAQLAHTATDVQLSAGEDTQKDQSYFLALVPKERLQKAIFPLGTMHKTDVLQQLAQRNSSIPAPEESQEICFIQQNDYRFFLEAQQLTLPEVGPILHSRSGQQLGLHKGLWQYTEGQRRGIGIAATEPLYVIAKQLETNTLLVGPQEDLYSKQCQAKQLNILVPPQHWPDELFVRTRYRQIAQPARVYLLEQETRLQIEFITAQQRSPKGQLAVVYGARKAGAPLQVLAGAILC